MKRTYKQGDTVRLLTTIRMEGWKMDCTPGYLVHVDAVNADGTLVVSRSGPVGRATVRASDVEPAYRVVHGTYYSSRTPRQVIQILEEARESGQVLRVHYGDRETGKDWLDEYDVEGTIGRSMGPVKIPLLITPGECGGPGMLDDAIVKIRQGDKTLYTHHQYHPGKIIMRPITKEDIQRVPNLKDYTTAIDVNGKNHANFPTINDAVQWVHKLGLTIKSLTGSFTGEIVCTG
jgi:hypothetical protein